MAGKTSYYSRLHAMLELTGGRVWRSSSEFVRSIVRKSPPNFVYHRWDETEEKIVPKCSESAVWNTFKLAVELGLLDQESAALTKVGKEAADPAHFDAAVRQCVRSCLKELGCPVEKVKVACVELLRSDKVVLPTVEELYLAVCLNKELTISESKFGILLRLLAACGGIAISRRHIFLPLAT